MSAAPDFAGVSATLQVYLDGLYDCDLERFGRVFHPKAQYCCATDGSLLHLDMPRYFEVIRQRQSPRSQGHQRTDRIVAIEFAGPVTAFARLECSIPGKVFTDFLTLIRVDGHWQIISKVFHYDPV